MSNDARALMSSAPDEPYKNIGFMKPLAYTGFSSGGVTFSHQQLVPAKPHTAVRRPESNGMAESFVKTMECDYISIMPKPDVMG